MRAISPAVIPMLHLPGLMMPGQFEGFGHRKIFMQQQVEAAIEQGARQVLIVGAGHTFEARHPFDGTTPELERALDATIGHFAKHLRTAG